MPSLRDRATDVPELAEQILERLAADYGEPRPRIDDQAMQHLLGYAFPGNVRELENILERAFTLCEDQCIQVDDLQLSGSVDLPAEPQAERAPTANAPEPEKLALAPGQSLEDFLEAIERQLITDALDATRWNKTAAAKQLGITFRALRYRLKKLELE